MENTEHDTSSQTDTPNNTDSQHDDTQHSEEVHLVIHHIYWYTCTLL